MTIPSTDAVLVHHDRHVLVGAPEFGQQRRQILGLGHVVRLAQQLLDVDVVDPPVVEGLEEVAHVQDADDLVDGVTVGRVARVGRVDDGVQALLGREVDRDHHDLGLGDHDVVGLLVGEVEDLVDQLLLDLLDAARLPALGDDHPDVLLGVGVHARGRRLDPEQLRDRIRGHLEQRDNRLCTAREQLDRRREPDRESLCPLERDRLGHQLAEHHAQVGQDHEREREGEARRQDRVEVALEQRCPDGAHRDAEDGDADLDGADEDDGSVHQAQRGARAAATAFGALPQP